MIFLKKLKLLFPFCLLQPVKHSQCKLRMISKEKLGSWADGIDNKAKQLSILSKNELLMISTLVLYVDKSKLAL